MVVVENKGKSQTNNKQRQYEANPAEVAVLTTRVLTKLLAHAMSFVSMFVYLMFVRLDRLFSMMQGALSAHVL